MRKRVLILSGLVDFQRAGNQTFKQTVKYLSRQYDIVIASFLPDDYPNLDRGFHKMLKHVRIYRLPLWYKKLFYAIRNIKNILISANGSKNATNINAIKSLPNPMEEVGYFGEKPKVSLFIYNAVSVIYVLSEFPRVVYLVVKYNPDFIYGYEVHGALLAAIIGKLFNIPVIKRFQGTPLVVKNNSIKHKWWHLNFILSYKLFKAPVIMANDGTRGNEVLRILGISKDQIFFAINGIVKEDMENIGFLNLRKIYELDQGDIAICMVSKLKRWKRVDRGLWALSRIVNEFSKSNYHLFIIGSGEAESYLKGMARRHGIEDHVHFVGALPHREAMMYIKSCDVFWSFYDVSNMGNPIMEAIYLGKPVFTIDHGGDLDCVLGKNYPGKVALEDFHRIPELTINFFEDVEFRSKIVNYIKIAKQNLMTWENRIAMEIEWIEKKLQLH